MATSSIDKTVRVWDVENQKAAFCWTGGENNPSCLKWSPSGNLLSLNEKKGKLTIIDIRANTEGGLSTISHPGPKAQNNCWVNENTLVSIGFDKEAKRKYCVWDTRNFSEPLVREDLGSGNSVQRLYFDHEHNLLFSTGRGSMEISLWKYDTSYEKLIHNLTNF